MTESQISNPGFQPTIGQYRILSQEFEGPMGSIYKAHDPRDRVVALQLMNEQLDDGSAASSRFEKRCSALEKIHSPHIVRTLDYGVTDDGCPFVAQEFIEGPSLKSLIADEVQLNLVQSLDLAIQACEGLHAAWNEGQAHRNIKPANLLVETNSRNLKIVNFSFADEILRGSRAARGAITPAMAAGISPYMSPEHFEVGKRPDHLSDIFSLGATLYHFLGGSAPFSAEKDAELIRKITSSRPILLQELNPKLPEGLCALVMEMLSKDPASRPQEYRPLISELEEIKQNKIRENEERISKIEAEAEINARLEGLTRGDKPASPTDQAQEKEIEKDTQFTPAAPSSLLEEGLVVDTRAFFDHGPQESHRFRSFALIFGLLILVIMSLSLIAGKGQSYEERGPLGKLGISIIRLFTADSSTTDDPQLELYQENLDRMTALSIAVRQFGSDEGYFPRSIHQLQDKGDLDSKNATDVWGEIFIVSLDRKQILSAGPDGEINTGDDWMMRFDGQIVLAPDVIQEDVKSLEEYERKERI